MSADFVELVKELAAAEISAIREGVTVRVSHRYVFESEAAAELMLAGLADAAADETGVAVSAGHRVDGLNLPNRWRLVITKES